MGEAGKMESLLGVKAIEDRNLPEVDSLSRDQQERMIYSIGENHKASSESRVQKVVGLVSPLCRTDSTSSR